MINEKEMTTHLVPQHASQCGPPLQSCNSSVHHPSIQGSLTIPLTQTAASYCTRHEADALRGRPIRDLQLASLELCGEYEARADTTDLSWEEGSDAGVGSEGVVEQGFGIRGSSGSLQNQPEHCIVAGLTGQAMRGLEMRNGTQRCQAGLYTALSIDCHQVCQE